MPNAGRFGPQSLGGPFSHVQQPHLQQHHQHHGPGSAGLPPPTFNSHGAFPQASQHVSMNSFGNHSGGLAPGFGSNASLIAGGTGLGSEAAQMGFRHGANLQQQQAMRRGGNQGKQGPRSRVRDVWAGNLAQEMQNLRELVEKYPYISMVRRLRTRVRSQG
jgi:CCR4-NOT transcription complex subunit 7/8